jgi:hypothetical protein
MSEPGPVFRDESRWPPALAILSVILLLAALPGHVFALPIWASYVAALVVLAAMAATRLARGSARWLGMERAVIVLLAVLYVANTIAELGDMLGIIPLHPKGKNAFSLMSSSIAIWIANVVAFSLLYWQVDGGGPRARASGVGSRPDWLFAQPPSPENRPGGWRPLFLDYLFLGYTTATAFSPCDVSPLTRRAKMLMMAESTISLLTTVIVLSRAINAMSS